MAHEHGWICLYEMVVVHSYISLPEGITQLEALWRVSPSSHLESYRGRGPAQAMYRSWCLLGDTSLGQRKSLVFLRQKFWRFLISGWFFGTDSIHGLKLEFLTGQSENGLKCPCVSTWFPPCFHMFGHGQTMTTRHVGYFAPSSGSASTLPYERMLPGRRDEVRNLSIYPCH